MLYYPRAAQIFMPERNHKGLCISLKHFKMEREGLWGKETSIKTGLPIPPCCLELWSVGNILTSDVSTIVVIKMAIDKKLGTDERNQ